MKGKGKTSYPDKSSNPDDDSESNTDDSNTDESSSDEDIREMMAMMVKGFKRGNTESRRGSSTLQRSLASQEKRRRKISRMKSWINPKSDATTVMGWDTLPQNVRRQRKHKEKLLSQGTKIGWIQTLKMRR